jgi:hypothetical protein
LRPVNEKRRIGILLGLAAQLDRLVANNVDQHLALLHDDKVVIWIERQRPLLVVERLVVSR